MRSLVPLLLLAAGCNLQPAAIVVGHVATLTGTDKDAGEQAVNGIRIALEDYASAADNTTRPIVVRHVDTKGELAAAEGQAVRLATVNRASILLGGTDAAEAMRIAKAGTLVLSPIGERSKSMSELIIPMGLSPAQRGKALAEFLRDKIKPASIVYLVEPGDDASAALTAFQSIWEEAKKPAPEKHEFGDATSDSLKTWGEKLPSDVLPVVFAPASTMSALARDTPFADRPLAYAGPELLRQPLKDRKALLYLSTAFAGDGAADEFAKRYQAKFVSSAEPHAALAYDDARIAFEALKGSPAKFRDELNAGKEFTGLTGKFTITGGVVNRPVFVGTLTQGTFSTAK